MHARKSFLKTYGLTPVRLVFVIFCSVAILELCSSLLWIQWSLNDAGITPAIPLFLSLLKFALIIVGVYFSTKAMARINARLKYYREHNVMTGLPNRNFFNRQVQRCLDDPVATEKGYSVVVLRLDDYDDLSYTLGHAVMDILIKSIYESILKQLSNKHIVCLLTNRAFAIGLQNLNKQQVLKKAKELIALFRDGINVEGFSIDVNVHAGIANFPEHGQTPSLLTRHAAVARFLAAQNHSRALTYQADLDPSNGVRLSLMSELLKGIKEDQFQLYVQPKIGVDSLKTVQVESLVRWIHPKYGFMNPKDFIPLAEKTGYINNLTLWILEKAIHQCRIWCDSGYDIKIAVNLSTENLMSDELIEQIPILIEKYNVDCDMLILEITESAMMKNPNKAILVINSLAKLGYRFSMDDFGTGYSSLEYIKRLPISELKIDKTFVQNIDKNKKDEAIVRGTTQLAHSMGLDVVAEGVETEQAVEILKDIGCDKLQGYYFSKPLPINEFDHWLQTSQFGIANCEVTRVTDG